MYRRRTEQALISNCVSALYVLVARRQRKEIARNLSLEMASPGRDLGAVASDAGQTGEHGRYFSFLPALHHMLWVWCPQLDCAADRDWTCAALFGSAGVVLRIRRVSFVAEESDNVSNLFFGGPVASSALRFTVCVTRRLFVIELVSLRSGCKD